WEPERAQRRADRRRRQSRRHRRRHRRRRRRARNGGRHRRERAFGRTFRQRGDFWRIPRRQKGGRCYRWFRGGDGGLGFEGRGTLWVKTRWGCWRICRDGRFAGRRGAGLLVGRGRCSGRKRHGRGLRWKTWISFAWMDEFNVTQEGVG